MDKAIKFAGGRPGDPGASWKTAERGAATSVLLAASPLATGVTGTYFDDYQPAAVVAPCSEGRGVAAHAVDSTAAERLWTVSEQLLDDA